MQKNKKNTKKKSFIRIFFGIILLANFSLISATNAQIYNFEPIPGQTGNRGPGRTTDFVEYLRMLYDFGIALAVILAIFMVAFGAFMYVVGSVGNAAKIANAKSIIMDAIIGLIMALTAWLILFIINPDFIRSGTEIKPDYARNLPPDEVCAGTANGGNGKEGQCENSFDGKRAACWEGKCEYVCYDQDGQARPNGYQDPKCNTIGGANGSVCIQNINGTSNCRDKHELQPGDSCGSPSPVGGFVGTCKQLPKGCAADEVKTVEGPGLCTSGSVCCAKNINWELPVKSIPMKYNSIDWDSILRGLFK